MIKFKIRNKEYGLDMDERCFTVGLLRYGIDKLINKETCIIAEPTFHTTIKAVRNRLLWLSVSKEFDCTKAFSELTKLFKDCAFEIDEILEKKATELVQFKPPYD